MAPRQDTKVNSGQSQHRNRSCFTDAEHAHIWRFVAEEFKQKNFLALQRYGDLLWEKYIKAGHSNRTLISLRSHFGRQMYPRMHMADLPKDELFGLLKYFRVNLTDQQVNYLEEKFKCEVQRNSLGIIVLPSNIGDQHVPPRKRWNDGQLTPSATAMRSTILHSRIPENVTQAPSIKDEVVILASKKPRIKRETDDDELIPLATSTPMDVDGCSTNYGELVRCRTLKALAGKLPTDAIFDGVPSETRRQHEEDVKPPLPVRRAGGSNQANVELLRQQIAAARKEVERYDSKINTVKQELHDLLVAKETLSG
ncbi:hypothetical protein AAVH_12154 [Aphelenchoides avenae]|nr:hypothetical protein AAVH_12154 [Aphelenchus avenae]